MLKKNFLLSPGPTPVPDDVMLEMAKPIFHHRTPQYQQIFKEVCADLKDIFRTKNDVFVMAASGTGAMEMSVVSFVSPGETVLVVNGGKFGERFIEIAKAYGINCDIIEQQWGTAVSASEIEKRLNANTSIKAVYTTLCETSTGVLTDMEAIGKVVARTEAILVTDAVSGLGADKLETDAWQIDVVVCGSQKWLMLPPGLAFMSVSPKAMKRAETAKSPSYYFNLKSFKKNLDKNDVPWTPAITLVVGLLKSLKMMKAEGMEVIWQRHARLAAATREAMRALHLTLYAKSPSNAVTAVSVPEGMDGGKLVKMLRDDLGITFAGGQGHLKGKLFRIAHMGYCNEFDVLVGIGALEQALKNMGYQFTIGEGVKAFQKSFLS